MEENNGSEKRSSNKTLILRPVLKRLETIPELRSYLKLPVKSNIYLSGTKMEKPMEIENTNANQQCFLNPIQSHVTNNSDSIMVAHNENISQQLNQEEHQYVLRLLTKQQFELLTRNNNNSNIIQNDSSQIPDMVQINQMPTGGSQFQVLNEQQIPVGVLNQVQHGSNLLHKVRLCQSNQVRTSGSMQNADLPPLSHIIPTNQNLQQLTQRIVIVQNNRAKLVPFKLVPAPSIANNEIKFKNLPFYDVITELIKPTSIIGQHKNFQEANIRLNLSAEQIQTLSASYDSKERKYSKQIHVRFCLLENKREQEDFLPACIFVRINNKKCPLPSLVSANKPDALIKRIPQPIDITRFINLDPETTNCVKITWVPSIGYFYGVTVILVHKRNSNDLLERLKTQRVKDANFTINFIKEKLSENIDEEIATTSLRVSTICPLSKLKMHTPSRSIKCRHLQCFDAGTFLQMNEQKQTWKCPICHKDCAYDDLYVDDYFQKVLESPLLSGKCNEIQLDKNGLWNVNAGGSEILIVDDDVVSLNTNTTPINKDVAIPNSTIIDLTSTSSGYEEFESSPSLSGINFSKKCKTAKSQHGRSENSYNNNAKKRRQFM